MRLYHLKSGDSFAFCKALADYLATRGMEVPAPLLRGEAPATEKGRYGKPFFAEPWLEGVYFSRSHTLGFELVCFSDSETGLDCENSEARPGIEKRYEGIAERFFADEERAYMGAGSEGALMRFFEIWTAKEAYMKYTGRGFAEGFRSFSVRSLPDAEIVTGRLDGAPHVVLSVCTALRGAETRVVAGGIADAYE